MDYNLHRAESVVIGYGHVLNSLNVVSQYLVIFSEFIQQCSVLWLVQLDARVIFGLYGTLNTYHGQPLVQVITW